MNNFSLDSFSKSGGMSTGESLKNHGHSLRVIETTKF